jgi:hypothetical protein
MYLIKFFAVVALILSISGCGGLIQNIQYRNPTTEIKNNKWDYFDGSTVDYTSFSFSEYENKSLLKNEDSFKYYATLNIDKNKGLALIQYQGDIVKLKKVGSQERVNILLERIAGDVTDQTAYKAWNDWFESNDSKFLVAAEYQKQIILISQESGKSIKNIAFYPSRYLACKELATRQVQQDKKMVFNLFKNPFASTNESNSDVLSTTSAARFDGPRDMSWAGDRGNDRLSKVLSVKNTDQKYDQAWNGLNCW